MSSQGYFYLIHFDSPIAPDKHTTQHYAGWELTAGSRIEEHKRGQGSRLCQVAVERGITFDVVLRRPADRTFERRMKDGKNLRSLCPVCQAEFKRKRQAEERLRREARRHCAALWQCVEAYYYLCAIIYFAFVKQARAI